MTEKKKYIYININIFEIYFFIYFFILFIYLFIYFYIIFRYAIAYLRTGSYAPANEIYKIAEWESNVSRSFKSAVDFLLKLPN